MAEPQPPEGLQPLPLFSLRGCDRCGIKPGRPHADEHAAEIRAVPAVHEFEIIRDCQRARGWHIAWSCKRSDCDAAGNMTIPSRTKAMELFSLITGAHRELEPVVSDNSEVPDAD